MLRLTLKAHIFLLSLGFSVLAVGSIVRGEIHDAQIRKLETEVREEKNKIVILTQLVAGLKEMRK